MRPNPSINPDAALCSRAVPVMSDVMPHSRVFFIVCVLSVLAAAACERQSELSANIAQHFASTARTTVNLAVAVPQPWERVCILGPYSDNQAAKRVLGFHWDVERNSSIQTNEGAALLLFVQGNTVVQHVEHRRTSGDFTNLSGRCFVRAAAVFTHVPNPAKGWPGLFPKNEA
jgi:hypothetical protein